MAYCFVHLKGWNFLFTTLDDLTPNHWDIFLLVLIKGIRKITCVYWIFNRIIKIFFKAIIIIFPHVEWIFYLLTSIFRFTTFNWFPIIQWIINYLFPEFCAYLKIRIDSFQFIKLEWALILWDNLYSLVITSKLVFQVIKFKQMRFNILVHFFMTVF